MALIDVHRQPETALARQFDGTLDSMLEIIGGRPLAGTTVTCGFSEDDGSFRTLSVSGPQFGEVYLALNDWVVFPSDPNRHAFTVPADMAGVEWTAS